MSYHQTKGKGLGWVTLNVEENEYSSLPLGRVVLQPQRVRQSCNFVTPGWDHQLMFTETPQSQLFAFGLPVAKQLLSPHFQSCCRSSWGFRNTSESRCFHTLSGMASNLLSGMWADWLGPCQRFSCSVLCLPHNCQIALEFTVGAFRPSAAAPAAPTAILHPRHVAAQDKKQLQSVSQEASSTWEQNCYANRLCTLILQSV